jgi:hypothetical protein
VTKPIRPKETKPPDPNILGEDAVKAWEEGKKKAKEEFDKALKEWEAKNPPKPGDKPAPKADPVADRVNEAIDDLYNVVHVPDKDTVKAHVGVALAAPAAPPAK